MNGTAPYSSMIRLFLLLSLLLAPVARQASASPTCAPRVAPLVSGLGAPDDLRWAAGSLWFGDLHAGVVARVHNGRVHVMVGSLRSPEGLLIRGHTLIVAEQGANQITAVNLRTGRRRVLTRLVNTSGRDGVDGIGADPHGGIYLANSPYGTLLLRSSDGRLHTLASGLGRPVDAIAYRGGVAVPDEVTGAVWWVHGRRVTRLATLATPDDVAVDGAALLVTSLGDGRLWEVRPHLRVLASGLGQPQGLAVLRAGTLAVANSAGNEIVRITGVAACLP